MGGTFWRWGGHLGGTGWDNPPHLETAYVHPYLSACSAFAYAWLMYAQLGNSEEGWISTTQNIMCICITFIIIAPHCVNSE